MENIQPLLFMMMHSKSGDESLTKYITLLLVLIPIILKIIPFTEIKDYIIDYFTKNNDYITINIPSHEVPILRSFSSVAIVKLVYSKNFLSLIHYITYNKLSNINSLTEIMASNSELNKKYDDDNKQNKDEYIYIPLDNTKNVIANINNTNIYCELRDVQNKVKEEEDNNDKKKTTTKISTKKNFVIILSIKKSNKLGHDISILTEFMKKCCEEYDLFINKSFNDSKQYIYEYKSCEKTESSIELQYDSYLMEHNKDLRVNIFFENKDKLINYITPFIYDPAERFNIGEEKYKRSGFTFKAGLLFYGAPGCGKTSSIKAILSFTNRHGIIINLGKVKTCEELQQLFRNRNIKDKTFTGKQLCYILEDCDAFDNNIIQSRKEDEDLKKNNTDTSELLQVIKLMESTSSTSTVKLINTQSDAINLSCFLNILDGIIELHGVMIIMTTNHPEKIDEALIRPGRFDFKHEFKRASKAIIKEMLQFKFELSKSEINEHMRHMNIRDETLSPAEIQSICFKHDNVSDCIEEIMLASQKGN